MALISLRQLLDHAAEHGYGLPAFNVNNMEPTEQVQTIMRAADAVDSPVILQDSAGARSYAGEPFLRHLIEAEVENYPHILVCMHQDHCASPDICLCSIQSGFSSVVMDGQGAEDKLAMDQLPTDPDEAVDFVNKTGLDALAIAIGTSHGAYKFTREPTGKIQHIDRVKEIHQRIPGVHLVMHASSSMPQDWMKIINSYGGVMGQTYGVPVEEIVESIKSSATLGPTTDDPKVLDALLHAGMDGTDAVMLSASTPGEPSMDNLKKQRHMHGMSEWYQAKGPYHYADWGLEPPRDNYDITTAVPAAALTAQEQTLNDVERLGIDIPGGWEQEKLTEELVRVQNESEKAYRSWARQVSMVVNSAKKSWRMPKRFIFHCCFLNQHEEITLLELNALVDSCFPLIRDRRSVMKRALNLSLSNSQRLRLTNRVLAELAGRSANQVVNYKRQIKDELGDLLRPLSQDPARYL